MIYFTNIKGERLPEDINKVANRYYKNDIVPNEYNEIKLTGGFYFEDTKEGSDIWFRVWYEDYQPFYYFHNPEKAKQARKAEIIAEIEKLQNELKKL